MSFDSELDSLAKSYGIEPFYWDIEGTQHVATNETKLHLLAAMGVPVTDEDSVAGARAEFELKKWKTLLPPTVIFHAGRSELELELRLPSAQAAATLSWELRETGFSGTIFLDSVSCDESYVSKSDERYERKRVRLPLHLSSGYHELHVRIEEKTFSSLVLAPPERCYLPALANRVFGISGQLYSFRSRRNCGLGDLGDLFDAKEAVAKCGASFVGLNPLHALFENNASEVSPYSPSSRLAWNPLIIATDRIPESRKRAQSTEGKEGKSEVVDYQKAWTLRMKTWREAYETFVQTELETKSERGRSFLQFLDEVNPGSKEYALYAALREHLLEKDNAYWGWPAWPAEYREPKGKSVREFAERHRKEIEFYLYLQFVADTQLKELTGEFTEAGIELGLYLDLALGANLGGAETWFRQELYAFGASMGAPPDELGPLGQVWGLPPLIPQRLLESRFEVFREALAKTMSRAKAVRIDHIMSLFRLFWVPDGQKAKDGGYVRYPFDELLAIVAIESEKHQCLVVGEDLGTVPDEVRSGMERTGILSYKVLYFMHHSRHFLPSAAYPGQSLVVTSTHDLPTLKSFWSGKDIELRWALKLFAEDRLYPLSKELRERDRAGLAQRLSEEGLFRPEPEQRELSEEALISFHRFLARAPSVLQAIQLEDLAQLNEQANVPGTVSEHPNWRRKLPGSLQEILESPFALRLLREVREERQRR